MLKQLTQFNSNISLLIALSALLTLILVVIGISKLRQRKFLAAGINGMTGILFLSFGLFLSAITINLHTYHRLTYEKEIAELSFQQLSPRSFSVTLNNLELNKKEEYIIEGDEWQLDARILKWKSIAQLLGLNVQYRLERLSGRYQDIEMERTLPRTIFLLGQDSGMDIWSLARKYKNWLPWIDAYYGNATYLPMIDEGRFLVSINQYGIFARPANQPAENIIQQWN